MNDTTSAELETMFLALGDKTRLRLLALMADGPVAVGFLADSLNESQPKVSRHLAYLRNAGMVSTSRDGKWVYYGIRYPRDAAQRRILESLISSIAVVREGGRNINDEIKEYIYDNTYIDDTDIRSTDKDLYEDGSTDEGELEVFLL